MAEATNVLPGTIPGYSASAEISSSKQGATTVDRAKEMLSTIFSFAYFGYYLMAASVLLPGTGVWVFITKNKIHSVEEFTGLAMIGLFIFVTMATIGLIVLGSKGELQIDSTFLKYMAGATVAEVAGMCAIIIKAYFSK